LEVFGDRFQEMLLVSPSVLMSRIYCVPISSENSGSRDSARAFASA